MKAQAMTWTAPINGWLRLIPNWLVYLLGALPGIYIVAGLALALSGTYDVFGQSLGIDPVKTIEHWLGELGLQFFIATLLITPLRDHLRLNLIKLRRPLGLLTFFYVALHLMVWLGLDIQLRWSEIWSDIWKRPYITIGMAAFLLMIPLAATSNNATIRRIGPAAWNKLHKLTYPAILLGAIHFVMVQKVWEVEPLIYLGVISSLLALRGKKLLY